ncbi:MAG TPA: BTAD domain-containing putative transcriptional regulator [Gaiellaceae bacterium]
MLEFRLLGSLEVTTDGGAVAVSGRNQRSLLTLLLLRANQAVSAERLVYEMWGEEPPKSAAASLQNAVSQLRKLLGPGVLLTKAPGYALAVSPEQIDVGRFERLVRESQQAVPAERSRLLREALALWHGPALADSELESFAQEEARRLEELRMAATEDWLDAELELEHHRAVLPQLESLLRANPLRERLRSQFMLALYRAGRQADALKAYHEGRKLLVDELGIEPGRPLQQLYAQILRQERILEPGAAPVEEQGDDSEQVWSAIMAGRLVPVLGTGAMFNGSGAGDARDQLAEHLARTFDCPREHAGDLAKVAQYVVVTHGVGPLYDELHGIFDRDYEPQPVHRFLAELPPVLRAAGVPQQLIVTTHYDCALELAFAEAGEAYDVVSYIALGRDRGKFLHRSAEGHAHVIQLPNAYAEVPLERRPVILKIHGEVDRGPARATESFVVSEDDHIAYLAETGLGGVLPVTLAARLRRSHFLFLGYGLLDWSLRVFLHRLWSDGQADYRSWAVQPSAGAVEREFWKRRGVEPSSRALDEFVALMRAHVTEGAQQ